MASKTDICLSEIKVGYGEECQAESAPIDSSDVSIEYQAEGREVCSEDLIRDKKVNSGENRSEAQEEEEKMFEEQDTTEEQSPDNSAVDEDVENLTENEEIEAETERKTENNVEKDTESKSQVEEDAGFKTDDEVDKDEGFKTDEEIEKETQKYIDEELVTDDETLIGNIELNRLNVGKKVNSDQEDDAATQESGSKSDVSQLHESYAENMDDDADSEAGGETDETEVEMGDENQAEDKCSRETSPTPCPPESPSESAPRMSVASTPDMKQEGGDMLSTTTVDITKELMLKLDGEINKDALFQQRFFILASNYDEMIKMKDEYKAENERLRLENMQMKMENTRIYNEKLESKERENHKLHQTVDFLKRDLAETQSKLRTANDDYKSLCLSYEEKILRLVQNLSVAEETLADTVFKLREQDQVRSRQERENRRQCERLQKEKNDLMELALSGDRNNFYLS